jgi:hypothetical protein
VLKALPPHPCVKPADLQRAFLMARNGMAGDPGGFELEEFSGPIRQIRSAHLLRAG